MDRGRGRGSSPACYRNCLKQTVQYHGDLGVAAVSHKPQHDIRQLIAGPAVFICDQCVGLCEEIVEEKHGTPDPATKQAREIRLEELKQLRADVARLHEGLARIEERINAIVEGT